MHGRLKIKTSKQREEEIKKEKSKKVAIFQQITTQVFNKIQHNIYDEEGMKLSGKALSACADIYTMWNYRRRFFKDKKTEDLNKELELAEERLRGNPKSYSAWHHRCWVTEQMESCDWMRELKLCDAYLEIDGRNFHCWDYRRFVVSHCDVTTSTELKFTEDLISKSFSNYSSLHYRSKLLSNHMLCTLSDDVINRELALAKNAFFTDPNDQSAWFYYRWLLGTQDDLHLICFQATSTHFIFVFNRLLKDEDFQKIKVYKDEDQIKIKTGSDEDQIKINWEHIGSNQYQCLLNLQHPTKLRIQFNDVIIDFTSGDDVSRTFYHHVIGDQVGDERRDLLIQEKCLLEELNEIEPDNKWVILTLILLLRKINPSKNYLKVKSLIDQLMEVDSMRIGYYRDLGSKFEIEQKLVAIETNEVQCIDLIGLRISTLHCAPYFSLITCLDLSGNLLEAINAKFRCLKQLEVLKANDNRIRDVTGLCDLSRLRVVELRRNLIECEDQFVEVVKSCLKIQQIEVEGNPGYERICLLIPNLIG